MLDQKINELKQLVEEVKYHQSLRSLLAWDQWMGLPKNGNAYRNKMMGYYAGKGAELMAGDKAKSLAVFFADKDPSKLASDGERGLIRTFLREYKNSSAVPVDMQIELSQLTAESQNVWKEAHFKADYPMFKPYMDKMLNLKMAIAEKIDSSRHPLSVLAENVDEGLDIEDVNKLFVDLREGVVDLLGRVKATGKDFDRSFLEGEFAKEDLVSFVKYLAERIGYDSYSGAYGEMLHPMTVSPGPKDSRISMNYDGYAHAVFAGMHEAGHGIYNQRSGEEALTNQIWGGLSGGFHESQARFYENIIGKSEAFWQGIYSETQRRFPRFADVSFEDYFRAINKVEPSLVRVKADELTYSLHPILRFEMEKDLFDGKIDTDKLPEIWNEKYTEYLGVTPSNDKEGVLQDIHWSIGLFGYFQSYAIGNLYGGQFRNALLKDEPELYSQLTKGDFKPLNVWLNDNIHQYGRMYSPDEMAKRVTGEPLKAKYFLDYLEEKYSRIYKL